MPSKRTHRRSLPLALAALAVLSVGVSKRAEGQTTISTTVVWTAPGDDGTVGRATRYDLRYSKNAISGTDTLGWWNAATIVNMTNRVPSAPGTLESMLVSGLSVGSRYYFVLRAADEIPNWSRYSNVASFIVTDVTPPKQIVDLIAR